MQDKRLDSIKKIKELTEGIDFCMLTTIDAGHLRSRPMSTQQFEFDGELWFLTSDDTHKVDEISKDPRVNVSYSAPDDNTYLSISGRGSITKDKQRSKSCGARPTKRGFPKEKTIRIFAR